MEAHIDLTSIILKPQLRVGVISDTHGNINKQIADSFHSCDVILHAGDIGSAAVLNDLKKFSPHVYSVRGNNDIEAKWPSDDLPLLSKIPESLQLSFNSEIVAITHGHQYQSTKTRHQKLREQFPQASIVIYGHSHHLVCDQEHTPWVINPGAGGYNRTFNGASCLVMQYENNNWTIDKTLVENNV